MNQVAPFLWLALAAFLIAVPGVVMLLSAGGNGRTPWQPRRLHVVRRCCGLLLILLALAVGLLAFSMHRYLQLFNDRPVAAIELRQQGPQHFRATVVTVDDEGQPARMAHYSMRGDAWMMEARVLRWRLPAALAGVPSLYRLERIAGRYEDIEHERNAERSAYELAPAPGPDMFSLKREYPRWMPFVDAQYGSATWMPMFDGARYVVLFNDRGGLLARPADDYTDALLRGEKPQMSAPGAPGAEDTAHETRPLPPGS